MYHVNPVTGEVGICKAKSPDSCPFGCENHSENLDDIQVKADRMNKKATQVTPKKITEDEFNNIIKKYKEDDTLEIIENYDFSNIKDMRLLSDIRNKTFRNIIFNNDSVFIGLELKHNTFENCDFSNVRLYMSDLSFSDFSDCDFSNSNFYSVNMEETFFNDIKLLQSKIQDCKLTRTSFSKVNGKGIEIITSKIKDSEILDSDFNNSTFEGSDINNTIINSSNFNGAYFGEVEDYDNNGKQKNIKSNIKDTKIYNTDFTGATFRYTNIKGMISDNSNFTATNFTNSAIKDSLISYNNKNLKLVNSKDIYFSKLQ